MVRWLRRIRGDERGGILTMWTLLMAPAAVLLTVVSLELGRAQSANEALQEMADDIATVVAIGRENDPEQAERGDLPLPTEEGCVDYPAESCLRLRALIEANLRANGIFPDTVRMCYSGFDESSASTEKSSFVTVTALWHQLPDAVYYWTDGIQLWAVSDVVESTAREGFTKIGETTDLLFGSDGAGECAEPFTTP